MKATIHRDSIKQKEIVKATIFLAVGLAYLLIKIGNYLIGNLL